MLNSDFIETRRGSIIIKEFDCRTVENAVRFVTQKNISDDIDLDAFINLYRFSHMYMMFKLMERLESWMDSIVLSENNIVMLTSFADIYDIPYLKQACLSYLRENVENASSFAGYSDEDHSYFIREACAWADRQYIDI
ncbi:hypothetical protein FO519_001874 [Halicephalobus sp. NKZ332]|nr:hypothetical protein FO519_001874 [Halicephalobus sp. NKZ332]